MTQTQVLEHLWMTSRNILLAAGIHQDTKHGLNILHKYTLYSINFKKIFHEPYISGKIALCCMNQHIFTSTDLNFFRINGPDFWEEVPASCCTDAEEDATVCLTKEAYQDGCIRLVRKALTIVIVAIVVIILLQLTCMAFAWYSKRGKHKCPQSHDKASRFVSIRFL